MYVLAARVDNRCFLRPYLDHVLRLVPAHFEHARPHETHRSSTTLSLRFSDRWDA